ncbi:MAG: PKD domain-containing protein [Candidatus Saccharicenans sp.]|nr:PKD domain-containing protein [Candidatus Saccharicenans sp.]MDI6848901.1 PKD domain-containing protein [Candidatus Saccharicenans sp.]
MELKSFIKADKFIFIIFISLFMQLGKIDVFCYVIERNILSKSGNDNNIKADFFFHPFLPSPGQEIYFINASTGDAEKYFWNFGDGQISFEKNPAHNYINSSLYYVTLCVSNGSLMSQATRAVLIKKSSDLQSSASEELKADFVFDPERPETGVPVRFYDKSTGNPLKRKWQFGYFGISLLQNPIRTFFSKGKYAVTLTVENESGADRVIKCVEVVPSTSKNIIIAKGCSFDEIRKAINNANPGDTVIVPNGQAVWSQKLVIRKGIILKAASKGGVTIKSNYASSRDYLIVYSPDNPAYDEPFRISGFLFNLDGNSGGISIENSTLYPLRKIRIDNNQFTNPNWYFLRINGTVYGVCDNNIVTTDTVANACYGLNAQTWNNLIFDFGTADNFYFEDNLFYLKDTFTGSGAAGRYAIRYNKFYNMSGGTISPFIDMHGNMGTGGNHSGMGIEVYENEFYLNGYGCRIVDQRGGKGLIYNNRIITTPSVWANFNVREEYYDYLNPPAKSPINGQPQHVSDTYSWGNTKNGVQIVNDHDDNLKVTQTLNYEGEGVVPSLDIHFWRSVSPFNGTSGVGVGTISQRPASCSKEGVAWWATDENRLYRWRNGKWELYYVPYTYPHPLRTILGD